MVDAVVERKSTTRAVRSHAAVEAAITLLLANLAAGLGAAAGADTVTLGAMASTRGLTAAVAATGDDGAVVAFDLE
jgi:hypothetical protein